VEAVYPSSLPTAEGGRVRAQRKFLCPAKKAMELGLRCLGKFWQSATYVDDDGWTITAYDYPVLPARYPSDQLTLFANSFSISTDESSKCSFNMEAIRLDTQEKMHFLMDYTHVEKMYFIKEESLEFLVDEPKATVIVDYVDPDWDCYEHEELAPGTAISSEYNPSYETYTVPSRNLVFVDMAGDNKLKDDTKAYMIIPKGDLIVHWHNIPVSLLCEIQNHLVAFRGKVNSEEWGALLHSPGIQESSTGCELFPAETVLFVDFEEDRSRRTTGFGPLPQVDLDHNTSFFDKPDMNTTTLKLNFKVKWVKQPEESEADYGWNHYPVDHAKAGIAAERWARVKMRVGDTLLDLFEQKSFSDILYPTF
jgi:hypothetical protein